MEERQRRAWAEVSLDNLESNYRAIRELLPSGCRFMGMVKSDAYGHGALPVARALSRLGADYLGVACLDEALELRRGEITLPILILGGTDPRYVPELLEHGLTQAVYDLEMARILSEEARKAGGELVVHLKADTGMSRLGFLCDEEHLAVSAEAMAEAYRLPGLRAEGIFTHFADSDEDEDYTALQFTRFLDLLDKLEKDGCTFAIRHCANSGATLRFPFAHLDMVRPGIALYGYYPGPDMEELCPLRPVMSLFTKVASVKTLPAGTSVSYGRTHTLTEVRRLAVVSIGYGDGFFRGYSNRFSVELRGKTAPILGRVCMDLCMVDVTDIPDVQVGDAALVYGGGKESAQSVERGAALMNTVSYELLCALSKRIPRMYLEGKHHGTDSDID